MLRASWRPRRLRGRAATAGEQIAEQAPSCRAFIEWPLSPGRWRHILHTKFKLFLTASLRPPPAGSRCGPGATSNRLLYVICS